MSVILQSSEERTASVPFRPSIRGHSPGANVSAPPTTFSPATSATTSYHCPPSEHASDLGPILLPADLALIARPQVHLPHPPAPPCSSRPSSSSSLPSSLARSPRPSPPTLSPSGEFFPSMSHGDVPLSDVAVRQRPRHPPGAMLLWQGGQHHRLNVARAPALQPTASGRCALHPPCCLSVTLSPLACCCTPAL